MNEEGDLTVQVCRVGQGSGRTGHTCSGSPPCSTPSAGLTVPDSQGEADAAGPSVPRVQGE